MKTQKLNTEESFIDSITAKWWFIALAPIIIFCFPPYLQREFALSEISKWYDTIFLIASNNFTPLFSRYSVHMNSIAILFIGLIFILKNKFSRIFSIYIAVLTLFQLITQNTSYTEQHGLGLILSSYILFIPLAGVWFWEAYVHRNNFDTPPKINFWTISALCIGLFAFWNPIGPNLMPDFNPVYFFTNGSNSMFCTMMPLVLAILFFFYPNVNFTLLRVTGAVGASIGLAQIVQHFFMFTSTNWWIGVLHIPIFILPLAAIILSFKTIDKSEESST